MEEDNTSSNTAFVVDYRWFIEAVNDMYSGRNLEGSLFKSVSLRTESAGEIMLNLTTVDQEGAGSCSNADRAIISESAFLKSYKWHNSRSVGGADGMGDFFSVWVLISPTKRGAVFRMRIRQQENTVYGFHYAKTAFCVDSCQFIWFSRQTKRYSVPREQMLLRWKFYGPSRYTEQALMAGLGQNSCSATPLGLTGLYGNSSLMNTIIQVLTHTDELVDYLLDDNHIPLYMPGAIVKELVKLVKHMWNPCVVSGPVSPRAFLSNLAELSPGYQQHEPHDIINSLLSALHDNLGRDTETSNESIMTSLFQGEFLTKLECPLCERITNTSQKFGCLPIPITEPPLSPRTRTVTLTVLSSNGDTLPFPVALTLPRSGQIQDIVEALRCKLGQDEDFILALVSHDLNIQFLDSSLTKSLETINAEDTVVAYRVQKYTEHVPLIKFFHTKGVQRENIFVPLVSRVPEAVAIRKEAKKLLKPLSIQMGDSPTNEEMYFPFSDLSVLFPWPANTMMENYETGSVDNLPKVGKNEVSLSLGSYILNYFTGEQILEIDNIDWCSLQCGCVEQGQKIKVRRSLSPAIFPEILVLELKRNSDVGLIDIPIEDFNVAGWLQDEKYEMYGMINQHAGHYSVVLRLGEKWVTFDDDLVYDCNELKSDYASILFYRKKKATS